MAEEHTLDGDILDLMARSSISFIGTVQQPGAAASPAEAGDTRTVTVHVDDVLHAPDALARLAGADVTVQLSDDREVLQPGERAALFTNPLAFGETVAVTEVARLPVAAVEPPLAASEPHGPLRAMAATPRTSFSRQLDEQRIRAHAADADAIVVGKVIALAKAGPGRMTEHDPDWWHATLAVEHVERGDVPTDQVVVLYANSIDVRWWRSPKPTAGQEGVWLLHTTQDDQRPLAPYAILHPDDYQPTTGLNLIRANGGGQ